MSTSPTSQGSARRPSSMVPRKQLPRDKPVGAALMEARYDAGQDLWSGNPLTGRRARHWLRIWAGLNEKPADRNDTWGLTVAEIVWASGNSVKYLREDGIVVHLEKTCKPDTLPHIVTIVSAVPVTTAA